MLKINFLSSDLWVFPATDTEKWVESDLKIAANIVFYQEQFERKRWNLSKSDYVHYPYSYNHCSTRKIVILAQNQGILGGSNFKSMFFGLILPRWECQWEGQKSTKNVVLIGALITLLKACFFVWFWKNEALSSYIYAKAIFEKT